MCLLAIMHRVVPGAPVLVAANREEFFNRPALPPAIQAGDPRVLCGTDARAGGTWLGVNDRGLVVGVTNRRKSIVPDKPRSRGTLCRELLACGTAARAVATAERELAARPYAGVNVLAVDAATAHVVHAGDLLQRVDLAPGLRLIANGDVDDPSDIRQTLARRLFAAQPIDSAERFVAVAKNVCATGPGPDRPVSIILRGPDRGTVSSTIIALGAAAESSLYLFAPQAPDLTPYDDYSRLLGELFIRRVSD